MNLKSTTLTACIAVFAALLCFESGQIVNGQAQKKKRATTTKPRFKVEMIPEHFYLHIPPPQQRAAEEKLRRAQLEAKKQAFEHALRQQRNLQQKLRGGVQRGGTTRGGGTRGRKPQQESPKPPSGTSKKPDDKEKEKEKRRKELEAFRQKMRQKEIDKLKAFLKNRDIETSFDGIQKYLRELTDETRDWSEAQKLIDQLSSTSYAKRVVAQEKLMKFPEVPIELLRQASNSQDREQAFRAKIILKSAIPLRRQTVNNVFRIVELLKITGLSEDLFKALGMFRDEVTVVRAAKSMMGEVATPNDVEFLSAQMKRHDVLAFQEVAIYALRLMENKSLGEKFHQWATDGKLNETFRLESTLALADLGDRRCLEVLLGFMEKSNSPRVRSRSFLAIRKLTDQKIQFSPYEDKADKRMTQVKQWKEWLGKNGQTVALRFPLRSVRMGKSYLNGHTLMAFGYKNKVVEYDEGMNEVWSYDCRGPWSAEKMANGNYLIAEYQRNRVIEVSPGKKIVREYSVSAPLNARPLENGNVLISSYSQRKVIEMTPEKKIVWEFTAKSLVPDAVRLENGNTLVSEYNGVVEVDKTGKRVWELNNRDITKLNQVMGIQALENGNVLISSMAGYVVEVNREKKEVWRHKCSRPSDAFRLENGNTLITEGSRFVEVTRDKKQVWSKSGGNYGTIRR